MERKAISGSAAPPATGPLIARTNGRVSVSMRSPVRVLAVLSSGSRHSKQMSPKLRDPKSALRCGSCPAKIWMVASEAPVPRAASGVFLDCPLSLTTRRVTPRCRRSSLRSSLRREVFVAANPPIVIGLNAVIVAVTRESPRILTISESSDERLEVDSSDHTGPLDVLPYGPLDPRGDRTLELALRRWVAERTGLELGYVEQLYTFGDRERGARPTDAPPRVISVAYLALVREERPSGSYQARWRDWYRFFPWEDWREGQPPVIRETVEPALDEWIRATRKSAAREERLERAAVAFGLRGSAWDPDRVLERYELLYEVGLVSESIRDRASAPEDPEAPGLGRPMGLDHRRILATGLGRMRGKLRYRPVVFELLPRTFTLTRLQRVVEALAGIRLHKQNFRRLVERGGLVEGTGRLDTRTGGRPAELFRFRREVLRERRAPGVRLPGAR